MTSFRIFKYRILEFGYPPIIKSEIQVVKGARILSVAEQRGDIVLYALSPLNVAENDIYSVRIIGTGHTVEMDNTWQFVGTVNICEGRLMFHVWVQRQ